MVVPNQVTGLSVTPKSNEVYLKFNIPNDNDDPITNYITEFRLSTVTPWTVFDNGIAPIPDTTVINLTNNLSYDFRVAAVNSSGTGPFSNLISTTPIPGVFSTQANVLLILKDHGSDVDLDPFWSVIELEDGIPQFIKITLTAPSGAFFTRGTKIQKYDRIYLRITDLRGKIIEDVFHVRKIKRSRKGGKGQQLILFCPHQSENLWKRNISILLRGVSGNRCIVEVISQLNSPENKGANDPSVNTNTAFDPVSKKGIALDNATSNIYIFEKRKLQEVFDKIADIEAQPIESGGSFEPFYIRFKSDYNHSTGLLLDQVSIQAYPQGFVFNTTSTTFTNIPNVTLKHGTITDTTTNTFENDSNENPELATNIHLVGAPKSGDFLGDWTKYFGAKGVFVNARTWDATTTFKYGALVQDQGLRYEAIAENTNQQPPNGSFWVERTFTKPDLWSNVINYAINSLVRFQRISYKSIVSGNLNVEPGTDTTKWRRISFAPPVDYSPMTKQKAQYWINNFAGGKYAATNNGQTQMLDPNIVVKDEFHPRTFGRLVATAPTAIPSSHKPNGRIPDGYRILVIDPADGSETGTGDFALPNTDRNGLTFPGNIAEYVDPNKDNTGEWVVFKATATSQDQEVFDYEEGLPWVKFPCEPVFTLGLPDRYVDNAGACKFIVGGGAASRQIVWKQGSYGISDIPLVGQFAVFYGATSPNGVKQFECAHSVRWESTQSRVAVGNKKIAKDDVDGNSAVFVQASANQAPANEQNPFYVGFNFWPGIFPLTSNAIPYGAVTVGELISTGTFDLDNMTRTADGIILWFGPKSEQYRPIQSFATWFQLIDTFVGSDTLESEGDYEIGIFLIDRRDNTRILPFTQGKNNDILPQEGKLPGDFYSGVPGGSAFFSAKEPEPTDAYDKNNILFAGIYTRDSFDTQGRYKSGSAAALITQIFGGKVNRFAASTQLEMAIDGFRPIKPLYVTNLDEENALPERNVDMVDQKKVDESNYENAKSIILGLARLFAFQLQEFEIDLGGRCDMAQGDCIYYTDTEQIDETTDSIPNTLKMTNVRTTYRLTKTIDGPAGFTAKISAATRLYPEDA